MTAVIATPTTDGGWQGHQYADALTSSPAVLGTVLHLLAQDDGANQLVRNRIERAHALDYPVEPAGPSSATPARWLYLLHADRLEVRHAVAPGDWQPLVNLPHVLGESWSLARWLRVAGGLTGSEEV